MKPAGDEPDQVPRLAAWRTAHPGWDIRTPSAGTGGTWRATGPDKVYEVNAYTLGELLDELDELENS